MPRKRTCSAKSQRAHHTFGVTFIQDGTDRPRTAPGAAFLSAGSPITEAGIRAGRTGFRAVPPPTDPPQPPTPPPLRPARRMTPWTLPVRRIPGSQDLAEMAEPGEYRLGFRVSRPRAARPSGMCGRFTETENQIHGN